MNLFGIVTVRPDYELNALIVLDQTELPGREVYVALHTPEEIWDAIFRLKVRGAPAIGVAAAYGISVCMQQAAEGDISRFRGEFKEIKDYLATSRPTAVNLFMALDRMEQCVEKYSHEGVFALKQRLREEAELIRTEDAKACRQIGEWGLSLLQPGMGVLTHCNAGHLAVSEYGTALAPLYLEHERDMDSGCLPMKHVHCSKVPD